MFVRAAMHGIDPHRIFSNSMGMGAGIVQGYMSGEWKAYVITVAMILGSMALVDGVLVRGLYSWSLRSHVADL